MAFKKQGLESIARKIYDKMSLGNAGFAFAKMVEEEFHIMAERGMLTQKSAKEFLSKYVVSMVLSSKLPLEGAEQAKVYRMVLNMIYSDFKDDIPRIKSAYRR
jgi:hypothetical protein